MGNHEESWREAQEVASAWKGSRSWNVRYDLDRRMNYFASVMFNLRDQLSCHAHDVMLSVQASYVVNSDVFIAQSSRPESANKEQTPSMSEH